MTSFQYAAFVSYSHEEQHIAAALQRGLRRFARPWYRLHAMRVYRDDTHLPPGSALRTALKAALNDSEYLLLIASPTAAVSTWVADEVGHFLEHRTADQIIVVRAHGTIAWGDADFDWSRTDSLPRCLERRFSEEPLYLDLGWARGATDLTASNERFHKAIASLASRILNRPLYEMIGADVRAHRRGVRVRWSAGVLFAMLLVASGVLYSAKRESDKAVVVADLGTQRSLAATYSVKAAAAINERQDPLKALLFACRAVSTAPLDDPRREDYVARVVDVATRAPLSVVRLPPMGESVLTPALDRVLYESPQADGVVSLWRQPPASPVSLPEMRKMGLALNPAAISPDGRWAATWDRGPRLWSLDGSSAHRGYRMQTYAPTPSKLALSPDGRRLVWLAQRGNLDSLRSTYDVWVWEHSSEEQRRIGTTTLLGSLPMVRVGERSILATASDNVIFLLDVTTGQSLHDGMKSEWPVIEAAFSPDGTELVSCAMKPAASELWLQRWKVPTGELDETQIVYWRLFTDGLSDLIGMGSDGTTYLGVKEDGLSSPITTYAWTGSELIKLPIPPIELDSTYCLSADGSAIGVIDSSGALRVWSTAFGIEPESKVSLEVPEDFRWGAFLPGAHEVLTRSGKTPMDRSALDVIQLWEVPTGRSVWLEPVEIDCSFYMRQIYPALDTDRIALARATSLSQHTLDGVTVTWRGVSPTHHATTDWRIGTSDFIPVELAFDPAGDAILVAATELRDLMREEEVFRCQVFRHPLSTGPRDIELLGVGAHFGGFTQRGSHWLLGAVNEIEVGALGDSEPMFRSVHAQIEPTDTLLRLAASTIYSADELRVDGDSLIADLSGGEQIRIEIAQSGVTLRSRIHDAPLVSGSSPNLGPTPLRHLLSRGNREALPAVSPNGSVVIHKGGIEVHVRDALTDEGLFGPLRHDDRILATAFAKDGRRLHVLTADGALRSWFLGRRARPTEDDWITKLGEALSGMQLGGEDSAQLLSAEDHQEVRQRVMTLLRAASEAGDDAAAAVLGHLVPDRR